MPATNTEPKSRVAEPSAPTRRFTSWFLILTGALLVVGIAAMMVWYFTSPAAARLKELSPQSSWDWAALIFTGTILTAIALVLGWITVFVIRFAHESRER